MKTRILLLLLLVTLPVYAQDALTILKFEEAEKAFNAGKFETVLEKLDEVEMMVQPTSKTLYLRIVSLNSIFKGKDALFNNLEQYQLLEELRGHVSTYLEAMGSYDLDDRFREVYQIGERLKSLPKNRQEWEKWNQGVEERRNPKQYYADGTLKSITRTEEGSSVSRWEAYYENGQLKETGGKMGAEKKTGHWKYYHENGQLSAEGDYWEKGDESCKIGKWVSYYDSGQVKEIVHYTAQSYTSGRCESLLRDAYTSYFKNGQVKEKQFYKVKKLAGRYVSRKSGSWEAYFENGQLKSSKEYDSYGFEKGTYRSYFENGNPEVTGQFGGHNGNLKVGDWKTFFENGDLKSLRAYSKDGYKSQWELYYPSGTMKEAGELDHEDNKEGKWAHYYENGQLKEEGKYKHHFKHGTWSFYDQNGTLVKKEKYHYSDHVK